MNTQELQAEVERRLRQDLRDVQLALDKRRKMYEAVIKETSAELVKLEHENAGLRQQLAAAQAREQQAREQIRNALAMAQLALVSMTDADYDQKLRGVLDERVTELEVWFKEPNSDHAALRQQVAAARREGREEAAKWFEIRAMALREEAQDRSSPFGAAFCDLLAAEIERAADAIRALPLEEEQ